MASALGGIAGTLLGGPIGGAIGSAAGGGLGSLFGGGSGTTQAPSTSFNPRSGTNQVYTPQAQPTADYQFQQVNQKLIDLANSQLYSSAFPGGVSPLAQAYGSVPSIVSNFIQGDPNAPGAYGPYGGLAVGGALTSAQDYQNLVNQPNKLANYGLLTGQAGMDLLPFISAAATNPAIGQAVQNIINNPYFAQQLQGAQTGAGIGQAAAEQAGQSGGLLTQLLQQLPGLGQQTAATTGAQIPLLQLLAQGSAATGAGLSGQAQGLLPQLQQLYGQTVPGLLQAGGQYAAQAGATTPQLQQIGASGQGLADAAGGYAGQAQAMTPYLQNLIAGQTIPGMQNLAQQSAGLAPQYANQLSQAAGNILQTGFDPQSALYNRTAQQLKDQQQAINAMSGVGTSPYGAGVTGQTLSNFNIDWQNQQLARQAQAGQAAAGLQQQALGGLGTAQGQLGATTPQALSLAQQQLAGTQAGASLLSGLTTAGGGLGINAANQQLQNVLGGGGLYGNLVGQAGTLGAGLTQGQLGALTGAGNLYNQGAAGAGGLATQAGGLANLAFNQQLAAAQGAGGLAGQALGLGQGGSALAAQAAGLPAQAYQQQQQAALQALQAQNQAVGLGVENLRGLTTQLGAAGLQPITALQAQNQLLAQPYQTATTQGQNALAALQQQINMGSQQFQLPQQVINNLQSYLGLGQSSSQLAGYLGQQGFNQNQQQLGNIGSLLGAGSNLLGMGGGGGLLFGSQGLGGALGIDPQTGLLGSFFGGGGGDAGGTFTTSQFDALPAAF